MIFIKTLFWLNVFIIIWAMAGYSIFLKILGKIYKNRKNKLDYEFEPDVTVMVVAHNEEKVILDKLKNLENIDYPSDKIDFLIASDYSTDLTNSIVERYMAEFPNKRFRLYKSKEHKGKTNAQNEAQKIVDSEILIMTDANAMFEKNAVKELVSSFSSNNIVYVAGQLVYVNDMEQRTAKAESFYWKSDLKNREIESNIQTITAGNGAIYACRNSEYVDLEPIFCHDSRMPLYYALHGKRAIYNSGAIAYEKAGEIDEDEFKRKVRMNRDILESILPSIKILNIFKYKWFSIFYFGHRTCRYLLWMAHFLVLVCNLFLVEAHFLYILSLGLQLLFYSLALVERLFHVKGKIYHMVYYYCMTILAQWHGVFNIITGKAKPTWEKAESTR